MPNFVIGEENNLNRWTYVPVWYVFFMQFCLYFYIFYYLEIDLTIG